MKKKITSLTILLLMMSGLAYAATYTYTGSNYTGAGGDYTTNMRVTGIIVTSSPIPPRVFNYDIRPILVSWSFNDGVQTIDSSNGEFSIVGKPRAKTDRQGNVIQIEATVVASPAATAVGESENIIWTEGHSDLGAMGFICEYANFGQGCSGYSGGPNFSGGSTDFDSPKGVWVSSGIPPVIPTIPTLSQWSLLLLVLLLGMVGIARVRRQG